ncbi:nucleoside-diphosphate sugar epimerase/dehydratase [Pedobacter sp. UBA5917]|jgi:hypothetical protein|uniref:nucleoside-diphosphate sugar epimerase/dehydratase n=1 Tax=Pedobacter sp. UBA5917 TaxID=1947061 RepID=UPI0025D61056|nr:hypothetical protein [Pedobacter sp. UBA5917]
MGFPLWYYFKKLESTLLRKSTHVISITQAFNNLFDRWKIDPERVTYIPNWAPLPEIGFIDEQTNPSINGQYLGKITDLPRILEDYEIDDVIVALPETQGAEM